MPSSKLSKSHMNNRVFFVTFSHKYTCLNHDDGGGERDRTDDLLRARQALSQLSYTPGLDTYQ